MTTKYNNTSPWFLTPINSLYLDTLVYRKIPIDQYDVSYIIEHQYKHRPDLLAYDMYGSAKLWWVFVYRNRNVLKDPIYDFLPGTTIQCPNKAKLLSSLGK